MTSFPTRTLIIMSLVAVTLSARRIDNTSEKWLTLVKKKNNKRHDQLLTLDEKNPRRPMHHAGNFRVMQGDRRVPRVEQRGRACLAHRLCNNRINDKLPCPHAHTFSCVDRLHIQLHSLLPSTLQLSRSGSTAYQPVRRTWLFSTQESPLPNWSLLFSHCWKKLIAFQIPILSHRYSNKILKNR